MLGFSKKQSFVIILAGVCFCALAGAVAWLLLSSNQSLASQLASTIKAGQLIASQQQVAPPTPELPTFTNLERIRENWNPPPEPKRGLLLIVPPLNERGGSGETSQFYFTALTEHFVIHKPRGIGFIPSSIARGWMWQATPLSDDEYGYNPEHERDYIAYFGATHVLRSDLVIEEDEVVFSAHYTTPEGEFTQEFRVPEDHDNALAQQVVLWALEKSGWDLSEEELEPYRTMLYGPDYPSTRGDRLARLKSENIVDEWLEFYEENKDNRAIRVYALLHILQKDKQRAHEFLLSEVMRPEASSVELIAAAKCADEMENAREAVRLAAQVMMNDPGHTVAARKFIYTFVPKRDKRIYFTDILAKWRKIAPESGMLDIWYAEALKDSAWQYRGSGYSNSVTQQGWRMMERNLTHSERLCSKVIDEIAPIPYAVQVSIPNNGSGSSLIGGRQRMHDIFNRCVARYPRDTGPWYLILGYERPRWSGTIPGAMRIIDEAIAIDRHNANFGKLAWWYHASESRPGGSNGELLKDQFEYFKVFPERADQILRSARYYREHNPKEGQTYLLAMAAFVGSDEEYLKILREGPAVYEEPIYVFEGNELHWSCEYWKWGLFKIGEWEHLLKAQVKIRELGHAHDDDKYAHDAAVALAFLGRFDEAFQQADAWRDRMSPHDAAQVNLVNAMANVDVEAALTRYRAAYELYEEKTDIDLPTIEAMLLARLGRMDEARAIFATTKPNEPREWDFVRQEALKLISLN